MLSAATSANAKEKASQFSLLTGDSLSQPVRSVRLAAKPSSELQDTRRGSCCSQNHPIGEGILMNDHEWCIWFDYRFFGSRFFSPMVPFGGTKFVFWAQSPHPKGLLFCLPVGPKPRTSPWGPLPWSPAKGWTLSANWVKPFICFVPLADGSPYVCLHDEKLFKKMWPTLPHIWPPQSSEKKNGTSETKRSLLWCGLIWTLILLIVHSLPSATMAWHR